jgi:hypothetical protein
MGCSVSKLAEESNAVRLEDLDVKIKSTGAADPPAEVAVSCVDDDDADSPAKDTLLIRAPTAVGADANNSSATLYSTTTATRNDIPSIQRTDGQPLTTEEKEQVGEFRKMLGE